MKKLILIFAICASAWAAEPTIKGVKVVTSPTDKVSGTVPVWNGSAWISGTNGSGNGDTIWTNNAGTIQATSTTASGNLLDVQHNATNKFFLSYWGGIHGGDRPGSGAAIKAAYFWSTNRDDGGRLTTTVGHSSADLSTYADVVLTASNGHTTNSGASMIAETQGDGNDYSYAGVSAGSGTRNPSVFIGDNNREPLSFSPKSSATSNPYLLDTFVTHTSGNLAQVANNGTNKFTINYLGKATSSDAIQTAAPNGGTAGAWKLGVKVDDTVILDTTKYIQIDIGGTLYKVGLVQ